MPFKLRTAVFARFCGDFRTAVTEISIWLPRCALSDAANTHPAQSSLIIVKLTYRYFFLYRLPFGR